MHSSSSPAISPADVHGRQFSVGGGPKYFLMKIGNFFQKMFIKPGKWSLELEKMSSDVFDNIDMIDAIFILYLMKIRLIKTII